MWTPQFRPATPERRELDAVLAREEAAGLGFAFRLRAWALAAIAVWLLLSVPMPRVLYHLAILGLFLALGAAPLLLRRIGLAGTGWIGLFVLLDAVLLTFALLVPNPWFEETWPPQITLRFHNAFYLFVFLAAAALSYSPGLMLWTGAVTAAAWSAGVALIWFRPETIRDQGGSLLDPDIFLHPHFVSLVLWQNQVVLLMIVALLLAAAVWRARRLVLRQAESEHARANLARYFSPNLVDQLARADRPFDDVRAHDAAVLFVDIVNFTTLAEGMAPERVIALLRSFHRRMARVVFAHNGTIDKYIGDAVMATFGTPQPGPMDATNALHCARGMLDEIARWNAKRIARGATPMQVGIGIHHGPVVAGNIGDERRLEFTVIGDVVNVASRLERLTRERQAPIVVSGDLIEAVRRESESTGELLAAFAEDRASEVRGRRNPVTIWVYGAGGRAA